MTIDIVRTARTIMPKIPFRQIAKKILGRDYELSLVLCGDSLARRMNRTYRKECYAPNVLSFPLGKSEGEIFLNVRKAAREAHRPGVSLRERTALLFVHGCLHLKGFRHGRIMEAAEQQILRRFNLTSQRAHDPEDIHGHRHRNVPRQDRDRVARG